MIGLDTTVLIAHELKEVENHQKVREHIAKSARNSSEIYGLTPQVIHEFIHVVTDSRRFERPLSIPDAIHRAQYWWDAAEIRHCHPGSLALKQTMEWLEQYRLGRKRILDTALAAAYYERGILRLATANPNDFAIFGVFEFELWAK